MTYSDILESLYKTANSKVIKTETDAMKHLQLIP